MPFDPLDLLPVAVALALALTLTPAIRALARRVGMVAQPKADRWHKKPTALLGGVAIALAVTAACLAFLPPARETLVVLAASAFAGLLGLVDDFVRLKPYQKLLGQVIAAALVVSGGLTLPWTASPLVNLAITLFWLIGIANAVNLLDNMDGLAAGVALIASVFLAVNAILAGQPGEALLLAVFAAGLLGFLCYNHYPASIFMGDCGSMFIGFFLASGSLLGLTTGGRSRSWLPVLAVPVLILLIPIFDTTLVTVLRKMSGRAISQGGRDHTSHRLVALGLSERQAVHLLYALATLAGLLALAVRSLGVQLSLALIGAFTVGLTLLGVYLAGVKVDDDEEIRVARQKPLVAFLIDLSYKRRVFEVLLDVVLIIVSYHAALALVFGPVADTADADRLLRVTAVLVVTKMLTFWAAGVYRGLWRYVSETDFVVFAQAVAAASGVALLAVWLLFGAAGLSRTVVVLDGLLLFVLLAGTRLAFRLFRSLLPHPAAAGGRRVLIYGAGDAGELLLREMLNNPALHCTPVGFLDDDPFKKGKVIRGLPVFGGNGSLPAVCAQHRVTEVVISSPNFPAARVEEIVKDCAKAGVALKRLRIRLEPVTGPETF